MAATATVPSFYLYGEPQRAVVAGFLHVEDLAHRSRPSDWIIRPHVHAELAHLILISEGGGSMTAEGEVIVLQPPCLLTIPVAKIHAFAWAAESRGLVLTMSRLYLAQVADRYRDVAHVLSRFAMIPVDGNRTLVVEGCMKALARELSWSAPARAAAVDAALLSILVEVTRTQGIERLTELSLDRNKAALVARFRARLEQRFRLREAVALHARALGTSESGLRAACTAIAGISPARMIDERCLLEAKRLLLYSLLSIVEIADAVGFADPAYFSRFFTKHVGQPPRDYRREQTRC